MRLLLEDRAWSDYNDKLLRIILKLKMIVFNRETQGHGCGPGSNSSEFDVCYNMIVRYVNYSR